jgi:hypothetical protein
MTNEARPLRPSEVWKRLSRERRTEAAAAFWSDGDSREQHVEAVESIARFLKFRPKSVRALPLDRKSRYLAALPAVPDTVAARALVAYHLASQRPMLAAFLEPLGIAHDNGLITAEEVQRPDQATLAAAATDLAGRFPQADVRLYFSTLLSQDPETWGGLAEIPVWQEA